MHHCYNRPPSNHGAAPVSGISAVALVTTIVKRRRETTTIVKRRRQRRRETTTTYRRRSATRMMARPRRAAGTVCSGASSVRVLGPPRPEYVREPGHGNGKGKK